MDYLTGILLKSIRAEIRSVRDNQEAMMATMNELVTGLQAVSAQVAKISTETGTTLQKVADLEAALAAAGNTTPEVDAALAALKAQVQAVDDLVIDSP